MRVAPTAAQAGAILECPDESRACNPDRWRELERILQPGVWSKHRTSASFLDSGAAAMSVEARTGLLYVEPPRGEFF